MNHIKSLLGCFALAIMLSSLTAGAQTVTVPAATAFSSAARDVSLSRDVQTVCYALNRTADSISHVASERDLVNALHDFEAAEDNIDTATTLTDADKAALKKSFLNFVKANTVKVVELTKKKTPMSEVDMALEAFESKLDQILIECVTLGDFLTKVN